jgi:hypothetical protein
LPYNILVEISSMNNFFHNIFQFFFLIGYIVLYIVSIIILRPFRLHRKRKRSTITLKISYLIYLLFFLCFSYLLLFGNKELYENEEPYNTLFNIHFLLFLTSAVIPNLGIMIRKRIKRNRVEFNISFTIVNIIYIAYLIFLCVSRQWALM